ncbi:MAG: GntR family transcriptional regulator [Cetobacterium sp.]
MSRQNSNSVYAYKILKRNIFELNLKPGSELSENVLGEKLGMSRTPIREALILLKHDQLIESIPQKGTFVTKISAQKVLEAKILRVALETAAFERVVEKLDSEFIEHLRTSIRIQRIYCEGNRNYLEFHKMDNDFHKMIFEKAEIPGLWELASNGTGHYQRVRVLNAKNKISDISVVEEHEEILEALEKKDIENLRGMLEHHLGRTLLKLQELEAENPEYFEIKEEFAKEEDFILLK